MQPKFTQQKLGYFCAKMASVFIFLAMFSQLSSAQNSPNGSTQSSKALKEQIKAFQSLPTSVGPAPTLPAALRANGVLPDNPPNPASRGFVYNGAGPFQLNKQSLTNTTLTPVGAAVSFGFPGAMAWNSSNNKLYVVDQASPFSIYTVDTATGIRTFVVNCTGVPQANLTGMTWDATTNTMYGASTSIVASSIFTINLSTGVCTAIGAPTSVAPGVIMINAARSGSLFSTDIVNDALYKWNKTTGVPTLVGPLGFDANFGQDGHFDPSDGQYYYACFNNSVFAAQLRILDTTNGSSTLIGSYAGQIETLGIYSLPPTNCSGAPPAPGNTVTSSTSSTLLPNGGFETGSLAPWVVQASNPAPVVNSTSPHSGTSAAFLGNLPGAEPLGDAAIYQQFAVPASGAILSYWYKGYTEDGITFDWQDAYITNAAGTTNLVTIMHVCQTNAGYVNVTYNLAAYAGQTIGIKFLVHQDGFGDVTNMYVDDVSLLLPSNVVCPGEIFTLTVQNPPSPFVVGYTYQWQSSPDNVTYTNISGATASTLTTSQSSPTWYRVIITCSFSGLSVTSTPIQMVDGTGKFTSQPSNASTQCGGNATFGFTATGKQLTYAWEYRTSSAGLWQNLNDGGTTPVVSGSNSNIINLTNVPGSWNGYQFRGLISGPCTAIDFTTPATLTVTPLIAIVNPTSATICLGTIQKLQILNSASAPVTTNFSSGAISLPVPDNNPAPTLSNITISGIPAGSVITNVAVHLNMQHTYPADMVFNLKGPNGQIYDIYKHNTNTDNGAASIPTAGFFDAVANATSSTQFKAVPSPYRYGITSPAGPYAYDGLNGVTNPGYLIMDPTGYVSNATSIFNIFASGNPNGVWTLAMCDGGGGDVGTLTLWSIDITYTSPVTGIWTSSPSSPNTMFTDPAATIAYTGTPINAIYVKPSVNTVYTVVVTIPTPCTSTPTNVPVNVTQPISGFTNPTNKSVCVGSTATFTVGSGGGPLTYQWYESSDGGITYHTIGGSTATLTLPGVVQTMNNFLYYVTVTASPCGSQTSAVAKLTVNPLPIVNITATSLQLTPGQTSTLSATSTPAATAYAWYLNGSAISGATASSTVANIDGLGVYYVSVTDVNGCVNTSNNLVIGAKQSDRLWIYPNPTTGQFQVRYYYGGVIADKRDVRIFDMTGRLVFKKAFGLASTTYPYLEMDFNQTGLLPAGTYVVKVFDQYENHKASGLLVVQ